MGHRSEIEDGMGFAGLVPSAAERAQERQTKVAVAAAKRELAEKIWAILKHEADYYDGMRLTEHGRGGKQKLRQATEAIECLFSQSGIELTTTQQQEDE
jgi:hypothetical protein